MKDGLTETNNHMWVDTLQARVEHKFPLVSEELYVMQLQETEDQISDRIALAYPEMPYIPTEVFLTDEELEPIQELPANRRARATESLKHTKLVQIHANNATIKTRNTINETKRSEEIKLAAKEKQQRKELSAWLVSSECMTEQVASIVKASGQYDATPGAYNPANSIICK